MTTRHEFPHRVRSIENTWIPLPDGARLAARLWLPEGAEASPVPAILEYLPYRKRDFMRARDEPMHSYFAGHGYASVRVDIRGSGDSDGVLDDEYSPRELSDALDVLRWIAAQSWCTGIVGMMGISWGGFNALQVAALQPPELGAVITLCSTDDRYADDAHYMGGCLLNENLQWGSMLLHYNAYPPDPELAGHWWREMWEARLENAVAFPALWMQHPTRDAYWRHGSVCEDFGAIRCPVYAVGGWADGYTNAVPRLLAGLQVPRKGLVGPWAHTFPQDGVPGPAIGFLQEALRWWDHWLKGRETGIMAEPMYRAWMQEQVPPAPTHTERPGRWVAEAAWPSPRVTAQTWYLAPQRLVEQPPGPATLHLRSPQTTGSAAGEWCAFGSEGEMPTDQRPDDGRSLCFDTPPLRERLEVWGDAEVVLELSVDRPVALVAVRLNDVAPDGASLRVTYGLLNLAHRQGHDRSQALMPGERYRVRVPLNHLAHAFPPGHRLRMAVSTTYWPIAWPAPEPAALTLYTAESRLRLPVRPPDPADAALAAFPPPERGPGTSQVKLRQAPFTRKIERDLTTDETIYTLESDGGELGGAALARIEAINLEVGYHLRRRFAIDEADPASARAELQQSTLLRRGDWSVRIHSETVLRGEAGALRFTGTLTAFEGEREVFRRDWDERLPWYAVP